MGDDSSGGAGCEVKPLKKVKNSGRDKLKFFRNWFDPKRLSERHLVQRSGDWLQIRSARNGIAMGAGGWVVEDTSKCCFH